MKSVVFKAVPFRSWFASVVTRGSSSPCFFSKSTHASFANGKIEFINCTADQGCGNADAIHAPGGQALTKPDRQAEYRAYNSMARKGTNIHGGYKGGTSSGPNKHGRGAPRKPPLTHFLCIPLVTNAARPQLEESLSRFRGLLAEENGTADEHLADQPLIPLKAVRPIGTIHFTIGVMSLTSIDRLSEAIGYLQTLDLGDLLREVAQERALESDTSLSPVRISLTSLHSMHPPKRTSILFAGPEDANDVLHPFCVKLSQNFRSAGFLVPDDRPLKLHATVLNTIYAKPGGRGKPPASSGSIGEKVSESSSSRLGTQDLSIKISEAHDDSAKYEGTSGKAPENNHQDTSHDHGPNSKAPIRLDATSLLDKCKKFVWASNFVLEKVAICKMGAKKILNDDGNVIDEQYEEVASVPLPS